MSHGLVEVLDSFFAAKMESVHTSLPGRIVSYEGHKTRRAIVQPMVRLELGTGPVLEIPPIQGVPVIFPSTEDCEMLFPIKPDSGCLILFTEAGIGRYLSGKGEMQDPDDQTRHSLTDAVCLPGLFPWKKVPKTKAPADAMWISYKGSSITLKGETFTVEDSKGNTIKSSGKTLTLNGQLEVDQ